MPHVDSTTPTTTLHPGSGRSIPADGAPRILLMLPYALESAPSQRYRIEQWRPWLEAAGARVDVVTLLTLPAQRLIHSHASPLRKAAVLGQAMLQRLAQLRGLRRYDVVWLHRAAWPVGPPLVERMLARTGVPVVYEFDDAIWMAHTAQANRRWQALKFARKTGELCALAAHVVVGNDYLADYARRFNPRVTVIPTTVDTDEYVPKSHYDSVSPVTLGWSGSITTLPHLRLLEPALQRLAREENIRLHVIGAPDYRMPGVETRSVPWAAERQVEELCRFDIGLMPLPDEEWARGKCACKALEYMAVGVPAVGSPVGVNSRIIRDDENGFLASADNEWVEKLRRLVREPALRERIGRAGRVTVEREYSARVQAPRVLELLRQVVAERPVTKEER